VVTAQGLTVNQSLGGEKIVFCIVCLVGMVVIGIIRISFVVLNCLYLNPQASPFVHFSSPSCGGWQGEGWASGCLVLSCQLQG